MADDNTIIEGTVKFRDGKKWKSRWCVMRKLSPVADCVHLQLYRDSKARWGGGGCKASLSLQQYLGCEAGFTLDKHSNTLAFVCTDLVAVLAFETRERLIQWQVKTSAHLGAARHYLVLIAGEGRGGSGGGGGVPLAAGPARLHLQERRAALTAGVPPRLLGVWQLPHLRRYGVVEGRFCFEGGSHCGKGEGLHVLITDRAQEIADDFELASRGRLSPRRRPTRRNDGTESPRPQSTTFRPDTRLSELHTIDGSLSGAGAGAECRLFTDEAGGISPYWPSGAGESHFQDMGFGDTASVHEGSEGADAVCGGGTSSGRVTLERCMSCMSKLGALSRSSTAAFTPGAHFSPAWTMDALHEAFAAPAPADDCAPGRPPKPARLELNLSRKPPMPLPTQTCSCSRGTLQENSKIGPYENYDVPKHATTEVDGEYYDTPKRLKECLNNELFKMTRSSTPGAVILKKPCGCLLKFGRRRRPAARIISAAESAPSPGCPCRRVTDWANSWIKLPYTKKNTMSSDDFPQNKENSRPTAHADLYATVDLSRKTRRKTHPIEADEVVRVHPAEVVVDEGPLANYENLNFALSLEYYENAKDLLRRAGVTQVELDAISANLVPPALPAKAERDLCDRCGGAPPRGGVRSCDPISDGYLMMEPKSLESCMLESTGISATSAVGGYTPMSPIGGFAFEASRRPARRLLHEKSASNPALCAAAEEPVPEPGRRSRAADARADRRKRSSSADSSRFLEDVEEFESGLASHGSSMETLRDGVSDAPIGAACRCADDAGKHSDADSSEAAPGPGTRRAGAAPGTAGNRDSSSSNDSGVSSCSVRRGGAGGGGSGGGDGDGAQTGFELPPTTAAARRHYRSARRAAGGGLDAATAPRRSRSTDPLRELPLRAPAKSSSAEAEVPVLCVTSLRGVGVADVDSTSSGTSDMSDYIETLSICSSHSSTDTPVTMRVVRETTSTLRPRSGKEYLQLTPRRPPPRAPHGSHHAPHGSHHAHLYSNLP